MKTALLCLMFALPALAQEGVAPPEERTVREGVEKEPGKAEPEKELSAPEFILHHVSDGDEYEFELPWPGVTHHPTLHLGEIFASLREEKVPGACSMQPQGALAAFPTLGRFIAGCWDFRPTKATLMMWIAALLLILMLVFGVNRDKSRLAPKGVLPNVIEVLVLFVRDEIVYKSIGKKEGDRYVPHLCTVFFFILFMNWLGLVPNFGSATGQLSVTVVLAVLTFLLVQIAGIRAAGVGGYLAHLTAGTPPLLWPVMIPVEFLSLFTRPFALTVRLFANMLGGHMVLLFIIGLIFMLHPAMAIVSVPVGVGIYLLEIFVGILQAYIFTLLSALYIGQSVEMGHHAHAHEEEHAHGH
jgi:F-type H+-transporting ATPase subunit a